MSERFKLLASTGKRLDRQATLRAAFDWSWDLLAPAEKAALAQLSVFEAGFTLESAEAVIDLRQLAVAPWPVDVVNSLVDKSFVRPLEGERFDLLMSVQAYAAEHLQTESRFEGSGSAALQSAQQRHADYFATLGPDHATAQACVELDNLIAACRRSVAAGRTAAAAGTLAGAWAALALHGPYKAGVDLAEAVCALPAVQGLAAAQAHAALGQALEALGQRDQAHSRYELALAHLPAGAGSDPASACELQLRTSLAWLLARDGQVEQARADHLGTLQMARAAGQPAWECAALNGLGTIDFEHGRMDEARRHYEAALALARRIGHRRWQGSLLGNLGNLHASVGRMDEALAHSQEALLIARELGDRQREGNTLSNLGLHYWTQGRLIEASQACEAALAVARDLGFARLECVVLCNLGLVLDASGQTDQAQARFEAALTMARRIADRRVEGQVLGYLGLVQARQQRFDEARQGLDAGQAILQDVADRLSLGVLLCNRAEAEWLAGSADAARAARDEAQALAAAAGAGTESELGTALDRLARLLAAAPA